MKFTAAHWGTYKVRQRQRKNFKLLPFEQDKDPSDIGRGIETAIENSSRIQKPAIRKGWLESKNKPKDIKRGEDEFVEVSWEDAFELVSDRNQTSDFYLWERKYLCWFIWLG